MRNGAVQLQKIRGVEISPAWLMRVYVQQWLSVDVDEVDEVEEVQLKVAGAPLQLNYCLVIHRRAS
jgi:hypothetical protein